MTLQNVFLALRPLQLHHFNKLGLVGLRDLEADAKWLFMKRRCEYAALIAEQWYAARHGAGYVLRLTFEEEFLADFDQYSIAYDEHQEIKVDMEKLDFVQERLCAPAKVEKVFWMKNTQKREVISFA